MAQKYEVPTLAAPYGAGWVTSWDSLSMAPQLSATWSAETWFAALASAAERRMDEFKAQNLANAAWAFAKVDKKRVPKKGK